MKNWVFGLCWLLHSDGASGFFFFFSKKSCCSFSTVEKECSIVKCDSHYWIGCLRDYSRLKRCSPCSKTSEILVLREKQIKRHVHQTCWAIMVCSETVWIVFIWFMDTKHLAFQMEMTRVWQMHMCWWGWIPNAHGDVRWMFIAGGNKHDISDHKWPHGPSRIIP